MRNPFSDRQRGFTMIEVITILLLIGIVSAVVFSRYFDTAAVDVMAQREVLKSHIRYAQSRSMHSNMIWGIQFSGATYSLFAYDSGVAITPAPIFPNFNNASAPMPPGISATGVIAFDFYGRPYYAADTSSPGTLTQTAFTGQITLTGITITPSTGFVP